MRNLSCLLICSVFVFSPLRAEDTKSTAFAGKQSANEAKEFCEQCTESAQHSESAENQLAQNRGPMKGRGQGRGMGGRFPDMQTIHTLFANRNLIKRSVKLLPNGAETITESKDPRIAALLQEHVPAMEIRVNKNSPLPPMTFHPVFQGLIKHSDDYTFEYTTTADGIKVTYQARDPYVIMLVQEHAKLVSRFLRNGMEEIHKEYTFPKVQNATTEVSQAAPVTEETATPQYYFPAIKEYGKVVQLPAATQQPQSGSKILVDITHGGEPGELNSAIEKVARFINIYQGAGKEPATVEIAVVLHGGATLAALNPEAYAQKYNTEGNPNLPCIITLQKAGVQFFVCGQSLIGKGGKIEEVDPSVKLAVSALSAMVNLQRDGFAYVPLP